MNLISPELKAREIYDAMFFSRYGTAEQRYYEAKTAAIIAVKQIIIFGKQMGIREPMMYWNMVEKELNKL